MENLNVSKFNYDAIKYFLCVAKHGSLSRAANSLDISQSALSQSMKNLEQSLGVTLFTRNTRGIILTDEGRVLYESASGGDKQFKNAIIETLRMKSFSTLKPFRIAISSSLASVLIAPHIREIQAKFADANFEFCDFSIDSEVVENLQQGKYDVAIFKSSDDYIVKEVALDKLCEETYTFVYNPKFFKFKGDLKLEDLNNYPIIIKDRVGKNDNSWIKFSFKKFICCKSDNQCLEFIKNGAGIGTYPKELAKSFGLEILYVNDYVPPKRVVNAGYLNSNDMAKNFVKFLKNIIK